MRAEESITRRRKKETEEKVKSGEKKTKEGKDQMLEQSTGREGKRE